MNNSKAYWEDYYSRNKKPKNPSGFAEFVKPFLAEDKQLVELGCGNGRDSVYFASNHINVTGIDQCTNEIDFLNSEYEKVDNLNFKVDDMTNMKLDIQPDFIYSRFTIHSINEPGEKSLIEWAFRSIKERGLFFIEVRSVKDELFGQGKLIAKNTYFTDHSRRFVDNAEIIENLESRGFNILYNVESNGLAVYKTEDPVIIRIIAQK